MLLRHWITCGSLVVGTACLTAAGPVPAGTAMAGKSQYGLPLAPQGGMPPGAMPPGPGGPMLGPPVGSQPRLMREYSWIHIDVPVPRIIKVHDIVTVIIDEKSQVTEDSRFNRLKNGVFKAELKDFIRINSEGNLDNAAETQPTIESRLQTQLNTRGQLQSSEGLRYRIAATVVDVLPNGTLVLEARKTIRTNRDIWEYTFTGRVRSQDVLPNNQVLSENVADSNITKSEKGRVRDSTRRGILTTVYDFFMPF